MAQAATDIIDLESSDDEIPVETQNAPNTSLMSASLSQFVIDLTLSDEEEAPSAKPNTMAAKQPVVPPPPLNGTPVPLRTQEPRQQTPIESPSSHSDISPVKRNCGKKRLLNNEAAVFRSRSPSPLRGQQARVWKAKRASNGFKGTEEEGAIKRPSYIAKGGLKVMKRLNNQTKMSDQTSAPKLNAGGGKQSRMSTAVSVEREPKKKIPTVKSVLNASFESLLPTLPPPEAEPPRADGFIPINGNPPQRESNADRLPGDNAYPGSPPQGHDFPEFQMDPVQQPPPLNPPAPSSLPARNNIPYKPYSPTAASRGAGPSREVKAGANLPPAGWHSQAGSIYYSLPPPQTTTPISEDTEDASPSIPLKPRKSLKRNRAVLSDIESDGSQPAKRQKPSVDDAEGDDVNAKIRAAASFVLDNPVADSDQYLMESDEEIDQLAESAYEDFPEQLKMPPSAFVEDDSEWPCFFDYGNDVDIHMESTGPSLVVTPPDTQEVRPHNAYDGDVEDSAANENSNPVPQVQRPCVYLEELKLKRLLDSYADVLDQYPSFTGGYRRPELSPADAPWVILRPFLERKLQLERTKLQKLENGE